MDGCALDAGARLIFDAPMESDHAAPNAVPDAVAIFRANFRKQHIGRLYHGWLHLGFTTGVCVSVIAISLGQLGRVGALEWLTVPLTFLYANLVEYWGHRGPMHHPLRGLRLIYERHARQHHRFFRDDAMAFDTGRDFKAVLFPPVLIVF